MPLSIAKHSMFKYNHYNIKHSDYFNERDFPSVVSELAFLKEGLSHLPGDHKSDIIISYLKEHHADSIWDSHNPKVSEIIASGSLIVSHLEWLFESCRPHKRFTEDFEYYIKKSISERAN